MKQCPFAGSLAKRANTNPSSCLIYRQLLWVEAQKRLSKTKSVPDTKVTFQPTAAERAATQHKTKQSIDGKHTIFSVSSVRSGGKIIHVMVLMVIIFKITTGNFFKLCFYINK